jgi:hypothetical protein
MSEAGSLQDAFETYEDDGLMILEIMIENNSGGTPSVSDLESWANRYDMTMPVLADEDLIIYDYANANGSGGSIGLPFTVVMGEGLVIESVAAGSQLNKVTRAL